jgi:peptide-methionine (S)-S-oxide reductase
MKATFGAGCFWHVEEAFRTLPGVQKTEVGFMGGTSKDPTYQEVCSDKTGHVEVVQITYDPASISYDELLKVFWKIHDPTQLNRQGWDVGSQYRSAIFYHSAEQSREARESMRKEQKRHRWPIETVVEQAGTFYLAEEYHQKYLMKRHKMTC